MKSETAIKHRAELETSMDKRGKTCAWSERAHFCLQPSPLPIPCQAITSPRPPMRPTQTGDTRGAEARSHDGQYERKIAAANLTPKSRPTIQTANRQRLNRTAPRGPASALYIAYRITWCTFTTTGAVWGVLWTLKIKRSEEIVIPCSTLTPKSLSIHDSMGMHFSYDKMLEFTSI